MHGHARIIFDVYRGLVFSEEFCWRRLMRVCVCVYIYIIYIYIYTHTYIYIYIYIYYFMFLLCSLLIDKMS